MENKTIYVKADMENIKVSFTYDIFIINKMREFQSRKFDKATKEHIISITHRNFNKLYNEFPVKLKGYTFVFDNSFKELKDYFEKIVTKRQKMREYVDLLIDAKLNNYDIEIPNYKPYKESMKHQILMQMLFLKLKQAAFLSDMGTGKTKASIDCFDYLYKKGKVKKCLVICKLVAIKDTWKEQIELFSEYQNVNLRTIFNDMKVEYKKFDNKANKMQGKKAQKLNKQLSTFYIDKLDNLKQIDGFHLINFDIVEDNLDYIQYLDYDMIIVDESQKIGNVKAKRTKAIINLGKTINNKLILTGTPRPNSILQLFGQYLFLDGGETFSKDIMDFYNDYFMAIGNTFKKWYVPKKEAITAVTERIYPRSITFRTDECLQLPELIAINKHIELTNEQKQLITDLAESDLTPVYYRSKIRSICSGFYYTENTAVDVKNNKLDLLQELIESILDEEEKVIVWVNFLYEAEMIKNLLDKLNIRYAICNGEITSQDKQDMEISRFKNSNTCNILINSFSKGAESLNLQVAKYAIVYSLPDDFGFYSQALKRNHRQGVKHSKMFYYNFICKNSIEEEIKENLDNKAADHNYIFRYGEKRYKYNLELLNSK